MPDTRVTQALEAAVAERLWPWLWDKSHFLCVVSPRTQAHLFSSGPSFVDCSGAVSAECLTLRVSTGLAVGDSELEEISALALSLAQPRTC